MEQTQRVSVAGTANDTICFPHQSVIEIFENIFINEHRFNSRKERKTLWQKVKFVLLSH